jgi:hypothetical protein
MHVQDHSTFHEGAVTGAVGALVVAVKPPPHPPDEPRAG